MQVFSFELPAPSARSAQEQEPSERVSLLASSWLLGPARPLPCPSSLSTETTDPLTTPEHGAASSYFPFSIRLSPLLTLSYHSPWSLIYRPPSRPLDTFYRQNSHAQVAPGITLSLCRLQQHPLFVHFRNWVVPDIPSRMNPKERRFIASEGAPYLLLR